MVSDRIAREIPLSPRPKERPILGAWQDNTFRFHSPQHERDWQQQAYRQSVDPDQWQGKPPVDPQTQTLLDGMPNLAGGQFFRGPDGKYRRITMEQREDKDIAEIRRKAFNELAQSGVTWNELAQYPDGKPHPGEAQALALREVKRAAADTTAKAPDAGQASDRFGPESAKPDLTRIAPDMNLGLAGGIAKWGLPTQERNAAPVLVATTDKAVGALPKEVEKSQPFVAPSPLTAGQRRSFNENLVGRAANDNQRSAANENSANAATQSTAGHALGQPSERSAGKPTITSGESSEIDADWQTTNRLFNWRRDGKSAPAPYEYAINVASEESRFNYLEEMKEEWSRLLEQDPEKVFRSMTGEVEKLSNAAMKDFVAGYHRQPNPAEKTDIEDAVAKMVFAPAKKWKVDTPAKPNEKLAEAKPYLALQQPVTLTGTQLADALTAASEKIANSHEGIQGGRPGSLSTRAAAETITKKLAEAIRACGGKVSVELYGDKEPQIQRIRHQVKGSRYPDSGVPFEMRDRKLGAFVSHYTPGADGAIMNLREAVQWDGLIENIGRAIVRGELGIEAAGVGAVRKQAPNESDEAYLKMIDDLIKDMIDCKRPFLIKLDINPKKISPKLESLERLEGTPEN